MNQLTLRKIPAPVENGLRKLAGENQQSLNKTVIKVLEKGLGLEETGSIKRDLSSLAGRWSRSDEKEFERNMAIFEVIDEEIWR